MGKPWERLEDETAKAFEAFVVYRDLGPNRSMRATAEKVGKSQKLMEGWSSTHKWGERAIAWDDEQDRITRQEQAKEIRKMRERHAQIARKALEKVNQALETINPEEMTHADMTRFMDVASKLERISRGDVGDVVEEREGEAIDPVQIYVPDNGRGRGKETFDDLEV